ncbi:MAG: glycosyltransferase [Candidatus Omnitrophica bacterium]|nr:glycosyltransferase [Candidatus Omnitrophota bacterium]
MKPLRLLLITNSLEVGGVETNLVALAHGFRRRGHAVTVAAAPGPLRAALPSEIRYAAVPADGGLPWIWWRAAAGVARVLREAEIGVIHAFSPRATLIADLARWQLGGLNGHRVIRPLLVSVPGGLQESPAESAVVTYGRLWPLWGADRILAISQEIRKTVNRLPGLAARVTSLCHIGLDLSKFQAVAPETAVRLRQTWGWDAATPIIGTIGALAERKSHDLFLRTASLVHRRHPEARFVIVGEGPLRQRLTALAQELGLGEAVRFLGLRHDIPEILAALDLYIKPGIVEGFVGITVLEAMAMAKPVIAFETEDVKAAIRDGQTGLLVPCGDVAALAEATISLVEQPMLRQRYGQAGHRLVEAEFEVSRVTERLEQFYAEALGA